MCGFVRAPFVLTLVGHPRAAKSHAQLVYNVPAAFCSSASRCAGFFAGVAGALYAMFNISSPPHGGAGAAVEGVVDDIAAARPFVAFFVARRD